MVKGVVLSLAGEHAVIGNMHGARVYHAVRIGKKNILGQIVAVESDGRAVARIFDGICTLSIGDTAVSDGAPMSIGLGVGIMGHVFDPLLRPIDIGTVPRYEQLRQKKWQLNVISSFAQQVNEGEVIGTVRENSSFVHKITVPYGLSGSVVELHSGKYRLDDRIGKIKREDGTIVDITLEQTVGFRGRRSAVHIAPLDSFRTGTLATNSFYPIVKGSINLIVGERSSGRTELINELCTETDTDALVFLVCGYGSTRLTALLSLLKRKNVLQRSVILTAPIGCTAQQSVQAVESAIAVSEYLCAMGYNAMLVIDALDRALSGVTATEADGVTDLLLRSAGAFTCKKGTTQSSLTVVATADAEDSTVETVGHRAMTYISLAPRCWEGAGRYGIDTEASFTRAHELIPVERYETAKELAARLAWLSSSSEVAVREAAQRCIDRLLDLETGGSAKVADEMISKALGYVRNACADFSASCEYLSRVMSM